jgi:hypothetical protein
MMAAVTKRERPSTFPACLRDIVEWLDASDQYIRTFGPAAEDGFPPASHRDVQEDLLRLASRLDDKRALSRLLYSMMTGRVGDR